MLGGSTIILWVNCDTEVADGDVIFQARSPNNLSLGLSSHTLHLGESLARFTTRKACTATAKCRNRVPDAEKHEPTVPLAVEQVTRNRRFM